MKNMTDHFEWKTTLINTYEDFIRNLIEMAPQIIGALALLVLGWVVAHFFRVISKKTMGGVDILVRKFTKNQGVKSLSQKSYASLISKVIFWSVFLFFIAAASNLLGWKLFSGWVDSLVRHLPNLFMGMLIILAGFIAGGSVRSFVQKTSSKAGLANGEILALIIHAIIVLTTIIVGVEQIGINVDFLTTLIAVIIGILLAGSALAFGLGARELVENIVAAQFFRKHCRIGEIVDIAGIKGEILEVSQTSFIIETEKGRSIIPAKLFHTQTSTISTTDEKAG